MRQNMTIPAGVAGVLQQLQNAGCEAYLVGGCVRDRYMGYLPHDYDVTTAALPEQVLAVFSGWRVVKTGLQHGTVTVLTAEGPVEVTTYRQDGVYSDHRHPDGVQFTPSLIEDLARRDFTMNAMVMDQAGQITDPFNGRADIDAHLVRCVGEPDRRFEEDALRILRGLRFAARLGFELEEQTALAMGRKKKLLQAIAKERVFAELCGLLQGNHAAGVLKNYGDVVKAVLPQLLLEDENLEHLYRLPPQPAMRLAVLLDQGSAWEIMSLLKAPNRFRKEVQLLVENRQNVCPPERKQVHRRCVELGPKKVLMIAQFQAAGGQMTQEHYHAVTALVQTLQEQNACFGVQDLAIGGKELMELGYQGPAVKTALEFLLQQIVEQNLPNEREILLEELKKSQR